MAKERRRGSRGRALVFVVVISGLLMAAGESDGDEPVPVLYSGYEGGACESTSRRENLCSDFAITPDGKTAYVVSPEGNNRTVTPIRTATNTPGKPIRIGLGLNIAITPDGKTLYAAPHEVVPISTATNTPGKPIPVRHKIPGEIMITPDSHSRPAYSWPPAW